MDPIKYVTSLKVECSQWKLFSHGLSVSVQRQFLIKITSFSMFSSQYLFEASLKFYLNQTLSCGDNCLSVWFQLVKLYFTYQWIYLNWNDIDSRFTPDKENYSLRFHHRHVYRRFKSEDWMKRNWLNYWFIDWLLRTTLKITIQNYYN